MASIEGFRVDREGVAELLRSPELAEHVKELAETVATLARARGLRVVNGDPLPIEVLNDPAPDRTAFTVAVRHPAGTGMEAKYGVLTRAAEAVGIEVHGMDPPPDVS